MVNVLPITSRKRGRKIYPNEVLVPSGTGGLKKESIILCHQVRTLDKKRLIKRIGRMASPQMQEEIIGALSFQLGIKE